MLFVPAHFDHRRLLLRLALVFLLRICLCPPLSAGQPQQTQGESLDVDTTVTQRFVAVHGRRSVIMGYPEKGLEVWAYPVQILDGYQIGFRVEGETSEKDARPLLRRLIYAPDSVTRIYVGPDYVVREKLFVPLDKPAAVVIYQIESQRNVDIIVHFTPVLNLMWPGGLGGQVTQWRPAAKGYVISQFSEHLAAIIASPDIHANDSTVNSTFNDGTRFSFTLHPHVMEATAHQNASTASLNIVLDATGRADPAAAVQALAANLPADVAAAAAHYRELQATSLQIETPDDRVNTAIAWAQIALDQAWVCNPQLGCGSVAGYGPSREVRRPQYDWFFGGDGLVATNALISLADFSRAREELEFVIRYQDKKTGMVWHELSQSAGYIDWAKYPYMFVHVDISLDYLNTVARYVRASGDTGFASAHWASLRGAYQYSRSLVSASDHIPHIPPDKEGADEQHRPSDDLGLSAAWEAAAQSFAELATIAGHPTEARQASADATLARSAIATLYWDPKENFWIDGHTAEGAPIVTRRSGFTNLLSDHIFTPEKSSAILDQLATSQFVTDWGFRGAATTPGYDPWSYSAAVISPLGTSSAALAFWQNHRPAIAESLWRTMLPLNLLDSPGHLLEVLSGNFYIEQTESVPEQTWASAGFLDATLRGLFGLEVKGTENAVSFSPRLPADWHDVSVRNIALSHGNVSFHLQQTSATIDLAVHNNGQATSVQFTPHLPLGATVTSADCNSKALPAQLSSFPQDQQAAISFEALPGDSTCHMHLSGGVSITVPQPDPHLGNQSKQMKLTSFRLAGSALSIDLDLTSAARNTFQIHTPWKVATVTGATTRMLDAGTYEVQPINPSESGYHSTQVKISFR